VWCHFAIVVQRGKSLLDRIVSPTVKLDEGCHKRFVIGIGIVGYQFCHDRDLLRNEFMM
jgi:hypothetical protein